ncbi:hypothetical protein [Deinococcus aquaticus]|uniref:hypothetical protein n=1 Tax=Deinococcus aquaticus TaxID=328692 RepID=UPI003F44C278
MASPLEFAPQDDLDGLLEALLPLAFSEAWHPVRSLTDAPDLPDNWWEAVRPLLTAEAGGGGTLSPEGRASLHAAWQVRWPRQYRALARAHGEALLAGGAVAEGAQLLVDVGEFSVARRGVEAWMNERIRAGDLSTLRTVADQLPAVAQDVRVQSAAAIARLNAGTPEEGAQVRVDLQTLFDAGERDGRFLYTLAHAFQLDGQYQRALTLTELALVEDPAGQDRVTLLQLQGVLLGYLGRLPEQVVVARDLIATARQEHDLYFESVGLAMLGYALEDLGQFNDAEAEYRLAARLMRQLGQGPQLATLLNNWAQSLALEHRPHEALQRLDQALSLPGLQVRHHGWVTVTRAMVHHLQGDRREALREARRAATLLSEAHLLADEAWARQLEAEECALVGLIPEAQAALRAVQDLTVSSPSDELGVLMTRGVVHFAAQEWAEARQAFETLLNGQPSAWHRARAHLYLLGDDLRAGRKPDLAVLEKALDAAGGNGPLRTDGAALQEILNWLSVQEGWKERVLTVSAGPVGAGVTLHLDLLGPLQVEGPGGSLRFALRRSAELLTVLALKGPRTRAQLLADLWEAPADPRLMDVFKKTLRGLRDTLRPLLAEGEDPVTVEGGLYRLHSQFTVQMPWRPPGFPAPGVRTGGPLTVRGEFASSASGPWADDARLDVHDTLRLDLERRWASGDVSVLAPLTTARGLT